MSSCCVHKVIDAPVLGWRQRVLDAFVVYFLLGPVMVGAWITLWVLVSTDLNYRHNQEVSVWISAAIGFLGSLLVSLKQDTIHRFAVSRSSCFFLLVSRVYSYCVFFISAHLWRSIWDGWNIYTGTGEYNAIVSGTSAFLALVALRCCRQVVFTPFTIVMDFPRDLYFKVSTYFGTKKSSGWRHFWDTTFSLFVVSFLCFTVWRGWWQFMDFVIYPHNPTTSAIVSLAVGYGIPLSLVVIQSPLTWLSAWCCGQHWTLGLVVEDVITCLVCVATMNYWRGYWILFDIYIPRPDLRYWLCHGVCSVILFFTMAFNSVLARGCTFDGEHTDGQGVVHDTPYVSSLRQL